MTECVECGQPDGAHLATCPLVPAPYEAALREIRDEVRLLRKVVSFALVLLVLWMLVWAVINGA